MWNNLSEAWQCAFEEAWASFKSGSIPIGAVISEENGHIILREHNRSNEPDTVNRNIAHAEANALRRLDTSHYYPKTLVLYSTMEPCPMCMGTAVMSNIKHLRYAARDMYCGCVHLKDIDPYLMGQRLDYTFADDEMEFVQLTIQSYHEFRYLSQGASDIVLNRFRETNERAVILAEKLFREKTLDAFSREQKPFSEVYDYILSHTP